jgi:class 3 adenylate cyclase
MGDDAPEYVIERDADAKVVAVRRVHGEAPVSLNQENLELCQFLNWAVRYNLDLFPHLERGDSFHISADAVVSKCKDHSVQFYVGTDQGWPQLGVRDRIDVGNVSFYRLECATAVPVVGLPESQGIARGGLPFFVSEECLARLNSDLTNEDSDIRRLSSWAVERTFVYVDISDFSKHPPGHQVLLVNAVLAVTNSPLLWPSHLRAGEARKDREANLCIGDGYVFVFKSAPLGAYFAGYLAHLIESLVARSEIPDLHYRMGVHTGSVCRFWDRWGERSEDGRWNYIGDGITTGERVLSAIKDADDVVYLSAETRQTIMSKVRFVPDLQAGQWLQNRGRKADKHGTLRRVYELNHTGWMADVLRPLLWGTRWKWNW